MTLSTHKLTNSFASPTTRPQANQPPARQTRFRRHVPLLDLPFTWTSNSIPTMATMDTYYDPHADMDREIHHSQSSESSNSSINPHESKEEVLQIQCPVVDLARRPDPSEPTSLSRTEAGVCRFARRTVTRLRTKWSPSQYPSPETGQETRSRKPQAEKSTLRLVWIGRCGYRTC